MVNPVELRLVQAPLPSGQLVLLLVPDAKIVPLAWLVAVVICIEVPVALVCTPTVVVVAAVVLVVDVLAL